MNELSNQKRTNQVNVVFLVTIVLSMILQVIAAFTDIFDNPLINIIVSQSTVIIPVSIWFAKNKMNPLKEIRFKKLSGKAVFKVVIFGFLIQPVLTFFNAISLAFSENVISSVMFDVMKNIPYLGALSLMALLPAICEETLYRGALYNTYRKASPWKAVILSAFLFGIMHGNLNQLTYAFVMGMIFALLIEVTGSILSTMIVHFMVNATSITAMYVLPLVFESVKASIAVLKAQRAEGAEMMEEFYTNNLGDLSLSTDEWMNQLISSSQNTDVSLGAVVATYLPSAMIFGGLAYLMFRSIANTCGTWNRFRNVYLGQVDAPVEAEAKSTYGTEKTTEVDDSVGDSSVTLITNPLFIGIAICIAFIFIVATITYLPV